MLIRVLEIPPSSGNFHFGGGEQQTFVEFDWFRDDAGLIATEEGRNAIANLIRQKRYFDSSKSYLILHQTHTFTIGYRAP